MLQAPRSTCVRFERPLAKCRRQVEAAVREARGHLRQADVATTLYRYDAQHSFFNEQREDVYSAENATLAWDRTLAFLREVLG